MEGTSLQEGPLNDSDGNSSVSFPNSPQQGSSSTTVIQNEEQSNNNSESAANSTSSVSLVTSNNENLDSRTQSPIIPNCAEANSTRR